MPRYLYGTPVLTISEVVQELNIAQGNVKQNHFASNLIHAKWVWKDLLWTADWKLVQRVLEVDKTNDTITLPNNMIRLINISVMDKCGNLQPIAHNPNINTLDIRCPDKTCTCTCGGKNTLCAETENITVKTETVTIYDVDYTKTIYTKSDSAGDVYEIAHTPVYNQETSAVEFIDNRTYICNLDVTETGCVKATEPNRRKLVEHCGCFIPFIYGYGPNCGPECNLDRHHHECETLIPAQVIAHFGFYNWDAQKGDVIHLKHVKADRVIVAYQNNGQETNDEMLVPEYAVETMIYGILWRQKFAVPSNVISMGEKQVSKMDYAKAKMDLFEFKNPLRLDAFRNAESTLPKFN